MYVHSPIQSGLLSCRISTGLASWLAGSGLFLPSEVGRPAALGAPSPFGGRLRGGREREREGGSLIASVSPLPPSEPPSPFGGLERAHEPPKEGGKGCFSWAFYSPPPPPPSSTKRGILLHTTPVLLLLHSSRRLTECPFFHFFLRTVEMREREKRKKNKRGAMGTSLEARKRRRNLFSPSLLPSLFCVYALSSISLLYQASLEAAMQQQQKYMKENEKPPD